MPLLSNVPVSNAIDTLWHADEDHIDVRSLTVPFPKHEFIVNLGDTFKIGGSASRQTYLFSPISTEVIRTRAHGRYHAVGAMFSPIGIYHTFGLSLREFRQQAETAPKDLLFGKDMELSEELQYCSSEAEKLKTLARFFQRNSVKKAVPDVVCNFLRAFKQRRYENREVGEMAQELGFTPKHLICSFKDVVGLTPKQYVLLLQINVAVEAIWKNPKAPLVETALESGFFDQSHFIRAFKKMVGMTPFEFRRSQKLKRSEFANTVFQ